MLQRVSVNSRYEIESLNEEVEVPPPTYNEIKEIIHKLRYNKAPGPDNIISELIKEGGQKLENRIYKLIMKIWEKEELPADWENSIICQSIKKETDFNAKIIDQLHC